MTAKPTDSSTPFPKLGKEQTEAITTLADLFMPLLVANPFSAMRASPRR
jgi:hypothetical protein